MGILEGFKRTLKIAGSKIIVVTVIFNLQEKSIADYFKAVIGKDIVKKQFHLASSQLFSQDGSVCSGYITEVVRVLPKEVIDRRER